MDKNLPVVLVTGAARRIGAEIARLFHSRGYNLVIHYRSSASDADRLCESLNNTRDNSAVMISGDLSNPQSVKSIVDFVGDIGRLDVLVNNASSFYPTPLENIQSGDWQELIGSNLQGPFLLAAGLQKLLRKSSGSIINIADIHASSGLKEHSIYCMAKAGNIGMTKSLARDLAPEVRVNSVAPGAILWPENNEGENAEIQQQRLSKIPLQRQGTPQEIAETVYFLAAKAHYITGQTISVDGGASHCF